MATACALGVDLGGTKIELALVDQTGSVLGRQRIATVPDRGADAIEADIVSGARNLLKSSSGKTPVGMGAAVAGQIDPADGSVRFAPNLKWTNVPLQAHLQSALKMPVAVINDVRGATWGEWRHGAGKGCDDIICLFVGTGVGGGVVSGGRILSGSNNSAGELGHVTIDMHGPVCSCGNRGCLESLAGGWAIARRAKALISAEPAAGGRLLEMADMQVEAVTAKIVADAAHEGDALAMRLVDEVAEALIAGAVGMVNAFNPRCFILGGGVCTGMPELVERVERGVHKSALASATAGLRVAPSALGGDAGVVGAAAMVMQTLAGREAE